MFCAIGPVNDAGRFPLTETVVDTPPGTVVPLGTLIQLSSRRLKRRCTDGRLAKYTRPLQSKSTSRIDQNTGLGPQRFGRILGMRIRKEQSSSCHIFADSAVLNSQLADIIIRAGLKPWPKLWVNLKATRATELHRNFPEERVTGWCGHTEAIASDHYWMPLQDDYDKTARFKSDAYHDAARLRKPG